MDRLPAAVTVPLEEGLVRSLEADELVRALVAVMDGLTSEITRVSPELMGRLEGVLTEIVQMACA